MKALVVGDFNKEKVLGLYIVRTFSSHGEILQSNVDVDSQARHGTVVTVYFLSTALANCTLY